MSIRGLVYVIYFALGDFINFVSAHVCINIVFIPLQFSVLLFSVFLS